MTDINWIPGDRIRYLEKDGRFGYGTVVKIDGDRVYTTLDGYPSAVKGCFHSQSPYVSKVVPKKKGRKK